MTQLGKMQFQIGIERRSLTVTFYSHLLLTVKAGSRIRERSPYELL
ncbi:MAG: hypothetical protein N2235_16245 [Fischerella sp.]|nr:hypothetical protein [Fischerella sp.]